MPLRGAVFYAARFTAAHASENARATWRTLIKIKRRLTLIFATVLYATLLGVPLLALGAPADLDTSFGTGGKVTTDFAGIHDVGTAMAVQTDGKILVAGHSFTGPTYDFALVRYNADGTPDSSFGNNGKVTR